ncbi:MAG TPA: hypothetical protein VJ997_10875 [Longimicrobiales bacterium]|nr:hypothetical protein [Longimicrobiales bacterium]
MTDEEDFLTEAEATRLWQRAAQLQADEARRAEARATSDAESAEGGRGERVERTEGYALAHVRTAAVEAGIGEEFVEAALAEVQSDRVMRRATGFGKRRLSRWVLGHPDDSLAARRVVHAAPADVLAAMEALFPNEPYTLTLRDRVGNPTAGGTLVFDIQGVGFSTAAQPGFRGDASYADVRQVYATLAPLPGAEDRTEVTLRAPVAWAYGINAAVSGAMTAVSGGIALMASFAVGALSGLLGPVGMGLLVATGGGLGTAGGLAGFRALYRYGHGRGTRALDALLAAVAAKAEGGWGIASGDSGRTLPPG